MGAFEMLNLRKRIESFILESLHPLLQLAEPNLKKRIEGF